MKTIFLVIKERSQLMNAPPEVVKELKERLSVLNPEYVNAKKYGRWIGKKVKNYLHFYTIEGQSIIFPRGFSEEASNILEKHGLKFKLVYKCTSLPEADFHFNGNLRKYQERAEQRVLRKHMGVLIAPTGSGKTVMGISIICKRKQPTLILVHTKELLYQWKERIESFTNITPGLIGDGKEEIKLITIGIVNSVKNRISKLKKHFGHLVVDECHRVPSTTFTQIVTKFDCKFVLGLSGTAYRNEKSLTDLIFFFLGPAAYEISQKSLEENGAILKPEYIQRTTTFSYQYKNDYSKMLGELTKDYNRNSFIVNDILTELKSVKGTILVVSDRVYHCKILESMLKDRVKVGLLTAGVKNRSEIIGMVQAGEVEVLIATVQLIGEGFDCSGLHSLFLTTPIKFVGRLKQVIGRIVRPGEGKTARVFDYIDGNIDVLWKSSIHRQKEMEK